MRWVIGPICCTLLLGGLVLLVPWSPGHGGAGRHCRQPLAAISPTVSDPSFGVEAYRVSTEGLDGAEAHDERPKDPPAAPEVVAARTRQPAVRFQFGDAISVQVNVDPDGDDIVGDAANEPSIAIDPNDPSRMVIGWRQFDSITSSFRQAGVGYTDDEGVTWTAGVVDPGAYRTDPVVASDAEGDFYYSSLTCPGFPSCSSLRVHVFKSFDGGASWPVMTDSYGGDKQWFAVDPRPAGMGAGFIYQYWTATQGCCPPNNFTLSVDGGSTFEAPFALPAPGAKWGTLTTASDGLLYLAGATANAVEHVVMRSPFAQSLNMSPFFDHVQAVDLGGRSLGLAGIDSPNPVGLMGQVWVATDPADPRTVYVLGSVLPDDGDPLDVYFIRSTDGGENWSAPAAVNDNAGDGTWQWFGMLSAAPDGRLDAVWNDTRASPSDERFSQLFHSYSLDGGQTWSANVAVTPAFNSHLGFPQENKLGDYNHLFSLADAVHVAYAATFNGGQDVYYVRIPIDDTPAPPPPPLPEPSGVIKNRFASLQVPAAPSQVTAIRVRLTSLHHPPGPPDAPDFSASEGEFRYVRLYRDAFDDPVFDCPDSSAYGTFYACAYLGCEPEYRDWFFEFGGDVLHVTGAAVVPSSMYDVAFVPVVCQGTEAACSLASPELEVSTGRWGDVVPGELNVLDVAVVTDKVVERPNAMIEPRGLLRPHEPLPVTDSVNVLDISTSVDALLSLPYPFAGPGACP